jgi:hypothetical protein
MCYVSTVAEFHRAPLSVMIHGVQHSRNCCSVRRPRRKRVDLASGDLRAPDGSPSELSPPPKRRRPLSYQKRRSFTRRIRSTRVFHPENSAQRRDSATQSCAIPAYWRARNGLRLSVALPPTTEIARSLPPRLGQYRQKLCPGLWLRRTLHGALIVKRFWERRSSLLFWSVSLFDLESRFFVPTRSIANPAPAGAVKGWPLRQPFHVLCACQAPSTAARSMRSG